MHRISATLFVVAAAVLASPAHSAQALPADPNEKRCWLSYTKERTREDARDSRSVTFSNLNNGFEVYSPFQVDFSVMGMGIAPAGVALDKTGHHHILVNTPLPVNLGAKIPFTDTHKHFGKGQTGAQLSLPPGEHKLRLLFADHEHRPHFVYSPEIKVVVKAPRTQKPDLRIDPKSFEATCARWYQNEISTPRAPGDLVYIKNLRANESVASPFILKFGVDGFGVCSAACTAEKTGRFVLETLKDDALLKRADLTGGQTEAALTLPAGNYRFLLRFVDAKGLELLPAYDLPIKVAAQ